MARGETYEEFTEKFVPKLTTDDCYTPDVMYEAVAGWVADEYGLDRRDFVRPFWPGADYQAAEYPDGCVVVDNPPFSILSSICVWYAERGILFFLFSPGTTPFGIAKKADCCAVCTGFNMLFENGADINIGFLTNLEDCRFRSAPELYRRLKEADAEYRAKLKKQVSRYHFPVEVCTAAMVNYMSIHGVDFKVEKEDTAFIRGLDAMKDAGKKHGIFGSAFLLSEKAAAEKAAAEEWQLSEREREICAALPRES